MIPLGPSAITPEAVAGGRFHNVKPPYKRIDEELPHHRHAAFLMAMGADTAETAKALGVTTQAVRDWFREPWFQERVSQIMNDHGGRDLTQLFANEAFASLGVMLQLRDDPKVSATVRNNICQNIIDRHLGKPTQRIETLPMVSSADPVAEAERLQSENLRLAAELNGSGHPTNES